jgi:hypothetical protein
MAEMEIVLGKTGSCVKVSSTEMVVKLFSGMVGCSATCKPRAIEI